MAPHKRLGVGVQARVGGKLQKTFPNKERVSRAGGPRTRAGAAFATLTLIGASKRRWNANAKNKTLPACETLCRRPFGNVFHRIGGDLPNPNRLRVKTA